MCSVMLIIARVSDMTSVEKKERRIKEEIRKEKERKNEEERKKSKKV